jgi:hypothetical protein
MELRQDRKFFQRSGCPFLIVVGVDDIGKDDRNLLLQHRLDHGECLSRYRIKVDRAEAVIGFPL